MTITALKIGSRPDFDTVIKKATLKGRSGNLWQSNKLFAIVERNLIEKSITNKY